jgi:methenyltetrahydromethanopterin cyclohydrolase
MELNRSAWELCGRLLADADRLRCRGSPAASGTQRIDCGIEVPGGIEAGGRLAEICLAGLGRASFVPSDARVWQGLAVQVISDHPVAACLASQYAGWEVSRDHYFAMGSGPMRASAAREPLFESIGYRETSDVAVGILESDRLPPDEVCLDISAKCGVRPERLLLLVAPTTSLAGTIQVVARSIETALHKLHELQYDVERVQSAAGLAPLPPVASDQVTGIGRTNDAIIYGGTVTLYVRDEDARIQEAGARVPSSASPDHGQPFARVFERYQHDFYRIDPHLFSPAVVTFVNLASGRSFRFGETMPEIIRESFGG